MESRQHSTREAAESAAARFIAQRNTGPWTQSDAAALQSWLEESASHRVAYYRLNAAWEEVGRLRALGAARVEVPAQRQRGPGEGPKSVAQRIRWAALAASVILVALGLSLWYGLSDSRNHFTTAIGVTETVALADESRVLLNTDSAIRVSLTAHERLIHLDRGEAYFEVAHDPSRPFIVEVEGRRVVAVGTQFAVRRDRNTLQVSVTEGTVRLNAPQKEILLPAGSIARVESDGVLLQHRPVAEVEQKLSWRGGVLTFRDTPLAEAVAEFNRYNTRKIVIQDPSIANLQVGGMFRANNVDPFVHLIEQGLPLQAAEEGDKIVLTARP